MTEEVSQEAVDRANEALAQAAFRRADRYKQALGQTLYELDRVQDLLDEEDQDLVEGVMEEARAALEGEA